MARFLAITIGAILVSNLLPIQQAEAKIYVTLRGSVDDNYFGLKSQKKRAASGSIAFDVGKYFRLGYTHRRASDALSGYYEADDGSTLHATEETLSVANSLDFIIILYYGELFVPYVLLGAVRKSYDIVKENELYRVSFSIPPEIVPNGGLGLGIRMSKSFSLKLSYTISQAKKQDMPTAPVRTVFDSYSSIGLTYNF